MIFNGSHCESGFGLHVGFSIYGGIDKLGGQRDFVLSVLVRVGGDLQCCSNSGLLEGCELYRRTVGLVAREEDLQLCSVGSGGAALRANF